jgi:methyltransferase (TIGR00027 family)
MKEGRPSTTAMFVAFARAAATHDPELSRICEDRFAERLLPHALGHFIASAQSGTASAMLFGALKASSLGMFTHLALRTRLIDDAVNRAAEEGVSQLVLLGAGLDARAHRLSSLRACTVFEVDFPATQAMKKRKARALPVAAAAVRYAPCDFEHETLSEALLPLGFDASLPSIWVWEGVTMYLPAAVVSQSLDAIAGLSAGGSTLITTYVTPDLAVFVPQLSFFLTSFLSLVDEPVRASFAPDALRALLTSHGFELATDVLPHDVAARYGLSLSIADLAMPREHVAVARRRRV